MAHLSLSNDASGIYTLCFDSATQGTNTLHDTFRKEFAHAVSLLNAERNKLAGVIVTSAKPTFFVGGDINEIYTCNREHAHVIFALMQSLKADLRILETLGKPVVAAINGAALGTGLEIALSCHYRLALDNSTIRIGFPSTNIGLIPGSGGIVRTTRLLGLENALYFLLESPLVTPREALSRGLIDGVARNYESLIRAAKAWIKNNPESHNPWDRKDFRIPHGSALSPALIPLISISPAMLEKKTRGHYPAQKAVLSVAVESTILNIDAALTIESRAFTELATGRVAKNMIGTMRFARTIIDNGLRRPKITVPSFKKIGIIGAGMMGVGIAHACAGSGFPVVLKDFDRAHAEEGKKRAEQLFDTDVARHRITALERDKACGLIKVTEDYDGLSDCDLIIEAVFEDPGVKNQIIKDASAVLKAPAVFASNTSALSINALAAHAPTPSHFIGLHFFSPVNKMALVEIVVGEKTSEETLARAFDFVQLLKKTPIVAIDSCGFYTSRVFGAFAAEGIRLVAEGQNPSAIETLAVQFGMPMGPLMVADHVGLPILANVRATEIKTSVDAGATVSENPGFDIVNSLIAQGRLGKKARVGFYDYTEGKRLLWPGLNAYLQSNALSREDITDRMIFIQSIEALRCLEEGVLKTVAEANVGSVLGWGFAPWTGGCIQFINHYGPANFKLRAEYLAAQYGPRFLPPTLLNNYASSNTAISDTP